jgi:dTDP-4-dehydrorhamnose reductase
MTGHLVIGGDGLIGGALAARLRGAGLRVWASTRRRACAGEGRPFIDLAAREWPELDAGLPVVSAHVCAAASRIAPCEADPAGTARINVSGTEAIVRVLAARAAHVVHLSTNQVLAGDRANAPADRPYGPRTEYGRQKAEAERRLRAIPGRIAMLRLAKVFGPGEALLRQWRRDLAAGHPIAPFADMTAAPVSVRLVTRAMQAIADAGAVGMFQLSAARDVSYADLAFAIARREGFDRRLVRPVPVAASGMTLDPPPFTSLDTGRLAAEFGIGAPDPFEALFEP